MDICDRYLAECKSFRHRFDSKVVYAHMKRRRDTHPAERKRVAAVVYNVQARGSASRCRDTAPFKMASTIGHCSNFRCPSLLFPLIITVCFSLGSFRFVSGLNPMSDLSLPSEAK